MESAGIRAFRLQLLGITAIIGFTHVGKVWLLFGKFLRNPLYHKGIDTTAFNERVSAFLVDYQQIDTISRKAYVCA